MAGCRQLAEIIPAGYRTTNVYSDARLAANIDPFSQRTSYTYNLNGERIATTNALNQVSTTVYDAAGRPIETIDPLGAVSTTIYNGADEPTATMNPLGFRTSDV
ncbi:RHS repeat domain-containing protein [Planctomicrobium sp. SH664]|uniref:RHS repeat domain-containing protein n=1 Tax=Planctomicrobium sp. SH664 TaxID=3448125 RepID=UPI003F5C3E50